MIPLRDTIPRVHKPYAVWLIILINLAVYVWQLTLTPYQLAYLAHVWGVVPRRLFDPHWAMIMGYPGGEFFSTISYMFLHGGFWHVTLNMWTLWIFADNIEDVMGPARFILFYLACGLAALGAHLILNQQSDVPVIGASGAIAGVMGAYFLLYPHSKVLTLIPIIIIPYFIELPATLFLAIWFIIQTLSGLGSLGATGGGGVAWWAHVGGFLAGMFLLPFFRSRDRCYYCYRDPRGRWILHRD